MLRRQEAGIPIEPQATAEDGEVASPGKKHMFGYSTPLGLCARLLDMRCVRGAALRAWGEGGGSGGCRERRGRSNGPEVRRGRSPEPLVPDSAGCCGLGRIRPQSFARVRALWGRIRPRHPPSDFGLVFTRPSSIPRGSSAELAPRANGPRAGPGRLHLRVVALVHRVALEVALRRGALRVAPGQVRVWCVLRGGGWGA